MLRLTPAALAVAAVTLLCVLLALLSSIAGVAVYGQQPAPSTSDCKAFPWKDASKAPALLPGMYLSAGQSIESSEARLVLTTSGDLRLVRKSNNKILWNTNTNSAVRAVFNGNLYLEDNQGNKIWTTNITNNAGAILQVQHDCNLVIYGQTAYTNAAWSTGTASCLKVHIIPHSHDDVGWLLTPERYFDGCQTPGGGVDGTITTAIQCLVDDVNRTYTQVESYFFHRWWMRQNSTTHAIVRKLVQNGQLDFTNGGWSMHDEACVHQESAIANMQVGANFLKEQFGDALKLKIGWHIDPFGHASATPRLMAQMGFDAFFFWRQDNQQRQYDMQRKGFESIWRSSPTLDGSYNMFTSILYDSYCSGCGPGDFSTSCPGGFCCYSCEVMEEQQAKIDANNAHGFKSSDSFGEFQAHTHEEQIEISKAKSELERKRKALFEKSPVRHGKNSQESLLEAFDQHFGVKRDSRKSTTDLQRLAKLIGRGRLANVASFDMDYLASQYAQMIRTYSGGFRTNQVLIPWGCDFAHDFAHQDYQLMDAIITGINGNPDKYGMELFYSSPRRYVNKISSFTNDVWPENHYDYFVYADGNNAYWSGYFTSRAEYKGWERWLMGNHRAAETVFALNTSISSFAGGYGMLSEFRQALGIAQHHDSITGTERTHVRNQYQYLLDRAYAGAQPIFQNDIKEKIGINVNACALANLSVCAETTVLASGKPVEIVLWNNLGQSRSEIVTIPIPVQNVEVFEVGTGSLLQSQVVDTWRLTTTADLTSPQTTPSHKYQVYIAVDLAPQAYLTLRILPSESGNHNNYVPTSSQFVATISNEYYQLSFDQSAHTVSGVSNLRTGISSALNQMIAHYCPHDNSYTDGSSQASGAYIFRTCTPNEDPIPYTNATRPATQWVVGPLCQEVRQVISAGSNIQQAWRLCKGFDYVELTNGLGELETGNNGREVIQRLSVPSLNSGETWYTDSEGLELQQRVRNFRFNYPYQVYEPIASNFFPCNAFATINATTNQSANAAYNMGIVMDRSRAVGSLHNGELEMLIHRRLLYDDGRGVGEPLDARTRVLSTSRLIFHEPQSSFMEKVRLHSLRHTHYPLWFASSSSSSDSITSGVAHGAIQSRAVKPVTPAGLALRGQPSDPLPPNVHIHALTYLFDRSLLVRLQHIFDRAEGPLAAPVTVTLGKILPADIVANSASYTITETDILGLNPIDQMQRNGFNSCQNNGQTYTVPPQQTYGGPAPKTVQGSVLLRPMEIRTFVIRKNQ